MALNRYRIGDLIKQRREKYDGNETLRAYGVARDGFIPPKQAGADTSIYNVFYLNDFVFNPARMELNSIALNNEFDKAICSSLYEIFYVKRTDLVLPEYLNFYIKRNEFARKCWFSAIGSARNYFRVNDLSEFEIDLPPIDIQKKYVDIYNAMIANQACYERGLEDLKLTCEGYIEDLRRKMPCEEIGKYLSIRDKQNTNNQYGSNDVLGVSQMKQIIATKANTAGNDLSKFTVIHPNDFVYNPRNGIAIGLNKRNAIISWNNTAFYINSDDIIPEYLMLWFSRKEWDRKVKIDSWGSSTEVYSFDALCSTAIPVPSRDIQQSVVDIFNCYADRLFIGDMIKNQIKNICPILIKGSLEEANK